MVGVLTVAASAFPYAAVAIATFTRKAEVTFDESIPAPVLELNGEQTTGEEEIVRALAKAGGLAEDSAKVCTLCARPDPDRVLIEVDEQTQAFFELAKTVPTITAFAELTAALDSLDDHLAYRTFLVGHDVTAADLMVWGALKGEYLHV